MMEKITLFFSSLPEAAGNMLRELSVSGWVKELAESGGIPGWQGLLVWYIVLAVWLFSPFACAAVAELYGHGRLRHFLLGLIFPYGYLFFMIKHIERREKKQAEEIEYAENEGREAAASEIAERFNAMREARRNARREKVAEALSAGGESVSSEVLDAAVPEREKLQAASVAVKKADEVQPKLPEGAAGEIYRTLNELPVGADGVRSCSLELTLADDGGKVTLSAIRTLTPEIMVCTLAGSGKTMRIKYDRVAGIEEL